MSRLHLVYGEAGAGTLRLALSTEGSKSCVVAFPAVLNYAPLFPSFDDAEIEEYVARCGEMLHFSEEYVNKLYVDILSFVKHDFTAYDEIVVWHGTSAGDRLFYYMVCSLVGAPLCEVDLSPLKNMLPNSNVGAISMSICSAENLKALQESVQPIFEEQKLLAAKGWTAWSKSEAALRVLGKSGEIVEAEEEVYDDAMLSLCRGEWVKAPIVVGRLLCEVDFSVGDSFLHHRIISLARRGRLQVRANARCVNGSECIVERDALPHVVDGVDLGELRLFEVKS